MTESNDPRRKELDALQSQLATRASILHLAHAAVTGGLAFLVTIVATQLSFEAATHAPWVAALASVLGLYALIRAVLGRRALAWERQRYAQMVQLRQALNLENPSALLPP